MKSSGEGWLITGEKYTWELVKCLSVAYMQNGVQKQLTDHLTQPVLLPRNITLKLFISKNVYLEWRVAYTKVPLITTNFGEGCETVNRVRFCSK